MEPPLAPPLEAFFTPGTGVPDQDLRAALAAEGQGRTMVMCGYNCLLVETPDGRAVIDTGLGARFLGYGPRIEPLVGRLGDQLAEAGARSYPPCCSRTCIRTTRAAPPGRANSRSRGDRVRARRGGGVLVGTRAITAGRRAPAGGARSDQAVRRPAAPVRIRRRDPPPRPRRRRRGPHAGPHGVRAGEPRRALLCAGDTFYDSLQLSHPRWRTPWDHDAERSVLSRRVSWLGRRREPPRPRVPHAVSRAGPGRSARQRLPVDPSRLQRGHNVSLTRL
jgi:hypothetical protein